MGGGTKQGGTGKGCKRLSLEKKFNLQIAKYCTLIPSGAYFANKIKQNVKSNA